MEGAIMCRFDETESRLVGSGGHLRVPADDQITRKLAMLIEGECGGLGPGKAAQKYGYSRQRYFQLRQAFESGGGAAALANRKRGPKTNYRRTNQAVREVIRHRFLDPHASAAVIAQKMRQCGYTISTSTVQRVIKSYGLEKKTLRSGLG
jgi:transposase